MQVRISDEGCRKLKKVYKQKGLTLEEWGELAYCSPATVKRFLRTSEGVTQENFEALCEVVDVDWRDVVEDGLIDPLLAEVREKHRPYLIEKHGKIRVLDIEQPIGLDDVFIEVKVLEQLTKNLSPSQANHPDHDFERRGFGRFLEEGLLERRSSRGG